MKEDITEMTHDIIAVYKERIQNLTWMSEETKEKAILKLDHMRINVGAPDYDTITSAMNENRGMHVSFDGFEEEIAEIFRLIIPKGIGIELNTNRGNTPLPDEKWLRLYRSLGGEIVTLGTDAHTPGFVGCAALVGIFNQINC